LTLCLLCLLSLLLLLVLRHLFYRHLMLPSLRYIFIVFLLMYVILLYLHSFPTRRSSDLGRGPNARRPPRTCTRRCRPAPTSTCRSEEHTSELQSHLNLVCRLLLEKKNYYSFFGTCFTDS